MYVQVASMKEEDPEAQSFLERELDRIFFYTCVRFHAEMCKRTVTADCKMRYSAQGYMPSSIRKQGWTYELALQLRLWRIASNTDDELLKILLYFQIVELSYPERRDYPKYSDSSQIPHPRTECKFVRHLVVHAGKVTGVELKNYCAYLGISNHMFDRRDVRHIEIMLSKTPLLEHEARNALQSALQPVGGSP